MNKLILLALQSEGLQASLHLQQCDGATATVGTSHKIYQRFKQRWQFYMEKKKDVTVEEPKDSS